MATLSDLRTHIKLDTKVNGTEKDSQVDNAIRSALRQLRGKRFWFLKQESTATLASTSSSIWLPGVLPDLSIIDDVQLSDEISVYYDGAGFDFLSYSDYKRKWYTQVEKPTGRPLACTVRNGTLTFSHSADQSYTALIDYYNQDETLPTADSDTSVWFDEGYDVVRSKAMTIFKREVLGYSLSEDDANLEQMYYTQLCQTSMAYEQGGR